MLNIRHNPTLAEFQVTLTGEEFLRRTESFAIDLIAQKLADKFVEEHGKDFIAGIDMDALNAAVEAQLKARLIKESTIVKDGTS